LHLGFNVVLGIRGDIANLDYALTLASRTINFIIGEDLRDIDHAIERHGSSRDMTNDLPRGSEILTVDPSLVSSGLPFPGNKKWRIFTNIPDQEGLLLVRTVINSGKIGVAGYRPDLSGAGYFLPGLQVTELRLVGENGEVFWREGVNAAAEGSEAKEKQKPDNGSIKVPVLTRAALVGPGGPSVVAAFPAFPFLFSALSKLPWTLGLEFLLILGLLGAWISFSRYLLNPLERVTRLALQMQERLFASINPVDLTESVANLADGIRDVTRNSRLSEVRVFCQTLSSALQGYVFQHEKIIESGKDLEKANRALSDANRGLLRRDEVWRKVLEISRTVTMETGFQKGLERVSAILADVTGAFGVVIGRIGNGRITALAWSGFEGGLEISDVPLDASIIGKAVKTRAPIWVDNVKSDPLYCPLSHKVKSELNIPMFHIGKAVGGVAIAWKETRLEDPALVELVMPVVLHIAGLINTQSAVLDLKNSYKYMAGRLQNLTAIYHHETSAHLERMEHYCRFLGVATSRNLVEVEDLALFSRLHDIGKLRVPMEILVKPDKLDPGEFEIVKQHTAWGAEILGDASWLGMGRNICRYHHEKWDGTGYPEGLSGESIPWEARIVALADVYDALRSSRSYKSALTHLETVRVMINGDGRLNPKNFDPWILEIFRKFHHKMAEIHETIRDPE
ncbi:MAG: HD domain-containing phosphohydrolase, partial [Thermovirgaceae bacterium]|nr:HD domain-containing phosphohydrolase [Thermovirgaceae bacterium]